MNTSSDSITGGILNIGDGTTVSDMSVSQGTIGANTTVNIKDNATLNVSGGNVNLNKNGSWDGNVNVSTGTLNIDSLSKGENGIFAQGGGTRCCRLCMQKSELVKEHRIKTNLDKYGVSTNLQIKEVVDLAKANSHSKEAILKKQYTNKIKYGYATPFQNKKSMDKAIFNAHTVIANNKRKDTCLKIYGVANPVQSKEIQEKSKLTCLKKYGVDNYSKTEKFKKYISDYISSDTIQNKINSTKRKNNTFNTSKPEDKAYEFLTQYTNVIRQYKCKCYPFCCDFYLKDFDIFIECNFHWTHGGHPFDPSSIKDQIKLERWKTKGTKYYDNAINTWTKMDVEKRNKAKEENLNYIEFWSLKELKEFFIDYFENHNIG